MIFNVHLFIIWYIWWLNTHWFHMLHSIMWLSFLADGRTDPGLSDVDQAFGLLGVSLSELEDYVNNMEPVGFPQTIPQFPISKSSVLQFPAAGFETDAREALRGERRDYIPEYFPPLVSLQEGTYHLRYRGGTIYMHTISYQKIMEQCWAGVNCPWQFADVLATALAVLAERRVFWGHFWLDILIAANDTHIYTEFKCIVTNWLLIIMFVCI